MTNAQKARLALETTITSVDALVQRVTAFEDFNQMVLACRGGYVPTIIPRKLSARASVSAHIDELAKQMLIAGLEAIGLKVWKGINRSHLGHVRPVGEPH